MSKKFDLVIDDWYDLDYLIKLMDKYGETTDEDFYGENQHGEFISIAIWPDNIILTTYQDNGWIRKNYYWRDGTIEEIFDGKWD